MTLDEAIKHTVFKQTIKHNTEYDLSKECDGKYKDCVDCILDKIRAEIEDLDIFYDNDYFSSNRDAMFKCSDVLQIIEKYRGSEGK